MTRFKLLALFLSLGILSACNEAPTEPTSASPVEEVTPAIDSVSESDKANQLFARFFEEDIGRSPEFQTALGRNTDMDKWDNLSEAFAQENLAISKRQLGELRGLDKSALGEAEQLSYELKEQALEESIEDFQWRLYDYPVNQMYGTHSNVPDLLINLHRVTSLKSAQDYIARLNAVPIYFDQLLEGLKQRAEINVVPPKFVFPHIIRDSKNIIKGAPFDESGNGDSALWEDFQSKVSTLAENPEVALSEEQQNELLSVAKSTLIEKVKPAYEKLIAYLQAQEQTATAEDGIWKVPNGDAFYNVALQRTTTTDMTAEEIHNLGLNEVARIHDEMRAIKDKVEFKGDLNAFMQYMRESKDFVYPNTAEGKARYLREATDLIDTMKSRLPELFLTLPKADITVKAVEAFREQSAGKAFYQQPSQDGSRPGLYYANLYDMEAMPIYQMEALAYHEGIPGHHMQIALAQELDSIPEFRKYTFYTAYIEGWGLYSEMVPKEIGFYSDPYSDFGRLAMELWRACRLVVDTGIHVKKWNRQQGIDYYVNNTPNAVSDAVKMVERHIVMPSQATAYKIGMLKIWQLREAAKTKLGDNFDIREFHAEILKYGPLPLNVVERKVDAWVASKDSL